MFCCYKIHVLGYRVANGFLQNLITYIFIVFYQSPYACISVVMRYFSVVESLACTTSKQRLQARPNQARASCTCVRYNASTRLKCWTRCSSLLSSSSSRVTAFGGTGRKTMQVTLNVAEQRCILDTSALIIGFLPSFIPGKCIYLNPRCMFLVQESALHLRDSAAAIGLPQR